AEGRRDECRGALYLCASRSIPRLTSNTARSGTMPNIPDDIFTEPEDISPDTLANLGPLRRLAGVWESDQGVDINPKADGPQPRVYRQQIPMEPILAHGKSPHALSD